MRRRSDGPRGPDRQWSGLEQRKTVLLLIAVIAAGQTFHQREHRNNSTDRPRALSAHELEDIRVLLLRHHARSGRNRAIEANECKLTRGKVNDVARDARERENDPRRAPGPVEREIPITDGM